VHSCYFSDHEWQRVKDTGGTISIAAQVETQMGHGHPPVGKSYAFGMRPSLSVDVVTTVPGDMFTEMRAAFGSERERFNAEAWTANMPVPADMPTARQMLEMATINGAHVAGLEDRTGSLTPGKRADVVMLDATAINMAPVFDPVAAVVLCADVSNVEYVMVDGRVVKKDFRLVADVAAARDAVEQARDRLVAASDAAHASASATGAAASATRAGDVPAEEPSRHEVGGASS
jgi:cytosine/adenosine deaminase-related metal-dependent hydrolase